MAWRWTLLALLMALSVALGACGGGDDEEETDAAATEELEEEIADGKFIDGLRIAGTDVGGMTPQEAQALLSGTFQQLTNNMQITIDVEGMMYSYPAAQLGVEVDQSRTLNEAVALGNSKSDEDKAIKEQAKASGYDATVYYTVNESNLNTSMVTLASEINREAIEPQVAYTPESSDRFTFTAGQDGKTLDTSALAASIRQAVTDGVQPIMVQAMVTTTTAQNSIEDLQQNVSKIVTFSTKYTGSSDRTENLVLGAAKLDGQVVKPGRNFSFNEVVGPRTEANGWKQAATIVGGNRYENDYGGGICQVSTTLYNAVLKADLKVVERKKHSIASNYIETGLDAMVDYAGGKDLVFQNNTDYPIYIFSHVDKGESRIYVTIYGRPIPNGETIILRSRELETIEPDEPEIIEDETMSPGKTAWEIDRRSGVTVEVYKEYKKDGAVLREETLYKETYSAIRGVKRVGVGSGGSSSGGGSASIPEEDEIVDFGASDSSSDESSNAVDIPIDMPSEGEGDSSGGDDDLSGLPDIPSEG